MKRFLSIFFTLAFVIVGAISFSACGNVRKGEEVYNLIKTQMELMLESGSPFVASSANGVTSNYMLDNFYKKTDNVTKVDYGWQNEMIAIGLNYIEKYYPMVQSIENQNSDALVKSLDELSKNYLTLKEEYQSSIKISDDEDMTIYNGFIAKYGEEARIFSGKVYAFADELSSYIESQNVLVKEGVVDQTAVELYANSRLLQIYSDYYYFVLVNCKGEIGTVPSTVLQLQNLKVKTEISEKQVEKFQEFFNALDEERLLTFTALEKFSYYDYQVKYNGDITAYEKSLSTAEAYLIQIQKYYLNTNNYMSLTQQYLTANIFA